MMFADHLFFAFAPAQMPVSPFALGIGGVTGISLGSFLQTAALRLNRGEDFILRPSACTQCRTRLDWWQNLPLFGYLIHRGRCRFCKNPISGMYFFVELVMGGYCALVIHLYPLPLALAWIGGGVLMGLCILTDLDGMVLYLPVMLLLGIVGMLLSLTAFWPVTAIGALLGMFLLLLGVWTINQLYLVFRKKDGFGDGDLWLVGAVGCWLGPIAGMMVFFAAALLGAMAGLALIATGRGTPQTRLPFGAIMGAVFICWPIINLLFIFEDGGSMLDDMPR